MKYRVGSVSSAGGSLVPPLFVRCQERSVAEGAGGADVAGEGKGGGDELPLWAREAKTAEASLEEFKEALTRGISVRVG